jgi:hypothetical protein
VTARSQVRVAISVDKQAQTPVEVGDLRKMPCDVPVLAVVPRLEVRQGFSHRSVVATYVDDTSFGFRADDLIVFVWNIEVDRAAIVNLTRRFSVFGWDRIATLTQRGLTWRPIADHEVVQMRGLPACPTCK